MKNFITAQIQDDDHKIVLDTYLADNQEEICRLLCARLDDVKQYTDEEASEFLLEYLTWTAYFLVMNDDLDFERIDLYELKDRELVKVEFGDNRS